MKLPIQRNTLNDRDALEESEAICIQPEANTNLCNPRTYIPTLKKNVSEGEHWLISAVYGSTNAVMPCNPPSLTNNKTDHQEDMVCFQFGNKDIIIKKVTKQVEVVRN